MYLLGQSLSAHKHVLFAIQKFEGIGPAVAQRICHEASVHRLCKVKQLSELHLAKLGPLIQARLEAERQRKLLQMKLQKFSASSSSTSSSSS